MRSRCVRRAAFGLAVALGTGPAWGAEAEGGLKSEVPAKAAEKAPAKAAEKAPAKATEAAPVKTTEKAPAKAAEKAAKPAEKPAEVDTDASQSKPAEPSRVPEPTRPEPEKGIETRTGAAALGPGRGAGDRKVSGPRADTEDTAAAAKVEASGASHRVGRAPRQPRPTLPEGVKAPSPDASSRRQVAGGPTADDLAQGKADPELRELSSAERVLFPKPLLGARPGWSWASPADPGAFVEATGLPSGVRSGGAPPSLRAQDTWVGALVLPNLPTRLDARVVKYLKFYRDDPKGRNILRVWVRKSGRLAPALRAELAKAGLPTDLVWLSLIESAHNPLAMSPAGAAGLWQFIPESARMYGLTVDRWVDERLDPERSTQAAVRYLGDLYSRFGSWELAMAAYNMGHGGLLRSVRKFNTNDFWGLSRYEAGLPWETTLYVPKILATAIAMANKKSFGVDDVEPETPLSFDSVTVGPATDLADVARAADVPVEEVRALNARYLAGRTPPATREIRRFSVRVPAGRGLVTEQRLAAGTSRPGREPHVVRLGDSVETVARDYRVEPREVAQLNQVPVDARLAAGSVVLVPGRDVAGAAPEVPPEEVVVVPPGRFAEPGRRRVFYRTLAGDQLTEVAAAFLVSPSEIVRWNGLDPGAKLQAGMSLQIFVPVAADLARVRHLGEHEVRVLVTGTEEFFEYFEAQNGRKRLFVKAGRGETLVAIGKRYGMSPGMMERINRVPASTVVPEGDTVVVYAKWSTDGAAAESEISRPLAAIQAPAPDVLPRVTPHAVPAPGNGLRAVSPSAE